jgi:hypothetical protein
MAHESQIDPKGGARTVADKPRYSSYIKDMPYLYLETRKAAKLIAGGETPDGVVRLSVEDNIFQLDKERRRLKLAQKVAARLGAVSRSVVELIANGRDENARIGAFYAIIVTDALFFEFMRDVYTDKVHIGQTVITETDISSFLRGKAVENAHLTKWTDDNLTRVRNTYKQILREAGLAKAMGADLEITRPITNDELKAAFGTSLSAYTAACCLEV